MSNANTSLLTAVIVIVVVSAFGYAHAVMVRAYRDYQGAKAAVKTLRTATRSSVWTFVKRAALVLSVIVVLVAWNVRDSHDSHRTPPATPKPSTPRGTPTKR